MNQPKKYVALRQHGDDYHQRYIELADHPHDLSGVVRRTVRVHGLIPDYRGPGIAIDFDKHGTAVGIEILYSYSDCEDGQ